MKKGLIAAVFLVFFASFVFAECSLDVSLVRQDPDPAVPGEYVKIPIQISGVTGTECGEVSIELVENYPLIFDPGFDAIQTFKAGTFTPREKNPKTVLYKVRIDPDALDGDMEVELLYSTKGMGDSLKVSKFFTISVEDVRANFDVFVKSYDYSNNRLVLEILNTAKNDVKAIIVNIPKQDNIRLIGSNKNIVGDLDSNDYTSRDFTAVPKDGKINLEIEYTDITGKRRIVEKEVLFESEYFTHTKSNGKTKFNFWMAAFVAVLAYFLIRDYRKKKRK